MTPGKLPHAKRFNVQKDERGRTPVTEERGRAREQDEARDEAQPLNDHPVHPYLSLSLSNPYLSFFFSSILLCTGRREGEGAAGTIIRNCFP